MKWNKQSKHQKIHRFDLSCSWIKYKANLAYYCIFPYSGLLAWWACPHESCSYFIRQSSKSVNFSCLVQFGWLSISLIGYQEVLERVRTRTQWVTLPLWTWTWDSTSVDSDSSAVDSDSGLMDSDSDTTQVDSDSQWVQVSLVRNALGKFKLSCAIIMDEIRGR